MNYNSASDILKKNMLVIIAVKSHSQS
uniref:Uncharacterized protein n=1 Tax=Anguilla anguilla TaxID=7936 RepID=A0A0E9PTC0_ANGAN